MTTTSVQPPLETSVDDRRRAEAVQRLRKRRDFHRHLLAYVLVNGMFVTIWLLVGLASDSWGFPWPIFPAFGWGIGLAFHALDTYGSGITEEQIQREMRRLPQ